MTTHPDSRAGEARSRALRTWEAAVGRLLKLPRPTHDHTLTRDLRIPTRDNAVLLADHVAPVGESRGTVLVRSPYGFPAGLRALAGGVFAGHGYHVVLARTRGTFGSGGSFDPFRTEVEDGADTVAWLRDQEWFGGRFATFGGSYLGFTQWALLMDPPPEMVTAIIQVGPHDGSRALHRGGAFNLDDYLGWSDSVAHQGDGSFLRAQLRMATQARRQRPVSEGLPLVDAADRLTGGRARWFRDWVTHRDLTDPYWSPVQLSAALDRTRPRAPAVRLAGPLPEPDARAVRAPARERRRGGAHRRSVDAQPDRLEGRSGALPRGSGLARRARGRRRRAGPERAGAHPDDRFRRVARPARVASPRPAASCTHSRQGLGDSPAPAPAQAGFTYDPAEPTPTVGGPFLRNGAAGYQDDTALAARTDVLTFTGPPLTEPLEVIGVPSVDIAHHSDNPHADLFVRVSEVDRKGRSRNVSDGFIRLDPPHRTTMSV